jgi:hypothetical protein
LDRSDGSSSLMAALSLVVELIEDCIDAAITNGVHWGIRSPLVAALSHFQELGSELELLGSMIGGGIVVVVCVILVFSFSPM